MSTENSLTIALASAPFPGSLDTGVKEVINYVCNAAKQGADIICFPESYLPGMRGIGIPIETHNPDALKKALDRVCQVAKEEQIYIILPMDWDQDGSILNVAFAISDTGKILGMQTKNQLDPSEEDTFIAGEGRIVFDVRGVTVGIVICHEGFRYPETVRLAARNGAKLIFHPHCNGSDKEGQLLTEWGSMNNKYFEKAMMCRALENTIYFASINYGFKYQESATSIINPEGDCIAYDDYRTPGILVKTINLDEATGLLAQRLSPEKYHL